MRACVPKVKGLEQLVAAHSYFARFTSHSQFTSLIQVPPNLVLATARASIKYSPSRRGGEYILVFVEWSRHRRRWPVYKEQAEKVKTFVFDFDAIEEIESK